MNRTALATKSSLLFLILVLLLAGFTLIRQATLQTNLQRVYVLQQGTKSDFTANDLDTLSKGLPDTWQTHFLKGQLATRAEQDSSAIQYFQQAVTLAPDLSSLRLALGEAYWRAGEEALAIAQFQQFPNAEVYLLATGRNPNAESYLRLVVAVNPTSSQAHYKLGDFVWQHGSREEAVSIYQNGIAVDDQQSVASNLAQARIHEMAGDPKAAIQAYKNAIALEPRYLDAYQRLGALYSKQGLSSEAIVWLEQAIEIEPNYMWSYLTLGTQYENLSDYQAAQRWFNEATERFPQKSEPLRRLGWLAANQADTEEAQAYFEAAIERQPKSAWAYYDAGKFFYQIERFEEAIIQLETALSLNTDILDMHLTLAEAYLASEQCQRAADVYQQWLDQKPTSQNVTEKLGDLPCTP
ncbi:MAG: tetratricopeptide repeat protein [Chloroflexota bacterium]